MNSELITKKLNINEIAWLYFLHYTYGGKMKLDSWKKDNRMGVNFYDVMKKASEHGLVEIKDTIVYSLEGCKEVIKNKLYRDTLEGALAFSDKLPETISIQLKKFLWNCI